MKCFSCGAETREGDRYCPYCGTEQIKLESVSTKGPEIHIHNHYADGNSQPEKVKIVERVVERIVVQPAKSTRSRWILLLLFFFLGIVGAHKFYAGKMVQGVLYLLTMGFFGFGLLLDFLSILFGQPKDADGLPICW